MKIKVEGRWTNLPMTDKDVWVYDVYHGFKWPIFFPVFTKWVIDKAGLDDRELHEYVYPFLYGHTPYKDKKVNILINL